ncbi:hypothetical protein F8S13_24320 [Chloroflexia bacterium SDU3-3]|nr:hypothetical protein F8S13_24320 [Chloroflexia bacterium SDU3-3]
MGFTYRVRKNEDVVILHHGAVAATLRGSAARDFIAKLASCTEGEAQQRMARLTGNYKRGNERKAGRHPRNHG